MQVKSYQLSLFTLFLGLQICAAAKCSYSLSSSSTVLGAEAVESNFSVNAGVSCAWSATTTNEWIHTVASGSGNGSAPFTLDANPSAASRTGFIKVETEVFTVTQSGVLPPLGGALDDPALVWVTSPDYPWFATGTPTFDGVGSAASGNRYVNSSKSWLETTVAGPGRISFWWRVDSDVSQVPPDPPYSFDTLQFLVSGTVVDEIMGQLDWNYRAYDLPAGTNTLRWQYVKDAQYHFGADRAWVDQVAYRTNSPSPLAKALNTRGIFWNCGGNTNPTPWAAQTDVTHDGSSAARSGAITGDQESWIEAVVKGATNVSFWWRVSSEVAYDWLEFYINGALANRVSGETGWQSNYFQFSSASTSLKWRYVKNGVDYFSKGQDCGWLDEVMISPAPEILPLTLQGPVLFPEGQVNLTIDGEAGAVCRLQSSSDLNTWSEVTNFILPGMPAVVVDRDPGTASSRFYRALTQ